MKKVIVFFVFVLISCTSFAQKEVGVYYSNWFSYPTSWPNTGGCTWAEPALGWYESASNAVIDKHTEWLILSGVDFVCFDWSNNCDNSGSNIKSIENNSEAFAARQIWRKQHGYKTVKYSVFIGTCGNCNNATNGIDYAVAERIKTKFLTDPNRAALYWNLDGKPFLGIFCLTCESQGAAFSHPSFTVRPISGGGGTDRGKFWSWEEKSPTTAGYSSKNGQIEAMTVEAAYRGTGCAPNVVPQYPNGLPGWLNDGTVFGNKTIPRNNGQTFRDALDYAIKKDVRIIIVQSFNEWTGCTKSPGEEMDQDRSNDIEPMLGGHSDLYIKILKEKVEIFKGIKLGCNIPQTAHQINNIPGTIEFENFDNGCQNEAYFDVDSTNNGGQYRSNEGVDIEICSEGGYDVGWNNTGEWLEYTVNVATTGKYKLDLRIASSTNNNQFHVEFDGIDKTGIITVNNLGSLQTWTTQTVNVTLTSGKHVLRFYIDNGTGGLNLNKMIFTAIATGIEELQENKITVYPIPSKDKLVIESLISKIDQIVISDIHGRIFYQSNEVFNQTKTVDISELQAGLYFIKFINEKNNIVKKFIKQ